MTNDIDKLLKQVFLKYREDKNKQVKGECLTEEDIADIIENKIDDSERKILFEHILTCQHCALELKENIKIIGEEHMMTVPSALMQKAKDLVDVEVGQNLLEIILDFKEKAIELIRSTGDILMGEQLVPVPVLRSKGEDKEFTNEIKVVKTFGEVVTEVGIEKKKAYLCDIEIRLTQQQTNKKMDDLRVTLLKGKREVESSLTERGKVVFRDISADKYKISVEKENKKIGTITLQVNVSK